MDELTPKQENTSSKEVIIDFLLEIIGYEKAMYKTFVDLRKRPQIVLHRHGFKRHRCTAFNCTNAGRRTGRDGRHQ